jgi:hypothetical protein
MSHPASQEVDGLPKGSAQFFSIFPSTKRNPSAGPLRCLHHSLLRSSDHITTIHFIAVRLTSPYFLLSLFSSSPHFNNTRFRLTFTLPILYHHHNKNRPRMQSRNRQHQEMANGATKPVYRTASDVGVLEKSQRTEIVACTTQPYFISIGNPSG